MKSFLVKNKRPVIRWTRLPNGIFYEGAVPNGFDLAIAPSGNYIIIDIDRHGDIDGFDNIPKELEKELSETYNYPTKNNGVHYWFKYTGTDSLANKTSGLGIDLRCAHPITGKALGYVVYYPRDDFRTHLNEINETSEEMNEWIESLFSRKSKLRK